MTITLTGLGHCDNIKVFQNRGKAVRLYRSWNSIFAELNVLKHHRMKPGVLKLNQLISDCLVCQGRIKYLCHWLDLGRGFKRDVDVGNPIYQWSAKIDWQMVANPLIEGKANTSDILIVE